MVSSRYPTELELRRAFEAELASVSGGTGWRSGTGLDDETVSALIAVARAYPDIPDELIAAARAEFAAQLDGTHSARRRAAMEQIIADYQREQLETGSEQS